MFKEQYIQQYEEGVCACVPGREGERGEIVKDWEDRYRTLAVTTCDSGMC